VTCDAHNKKAPAPAPKTIPHAFGFRREIDLDKLNHLADELEAEAYAAKQDPRRL